MEKINRQRAPKGTVTIRKKGNSYEARVTLALNSIMEELIEILDYLEQQEVNKRQEKD